MRPRGNGGARSFVRRYMRVALVIGEFFFPGFFHSPQRNFFNKLVFNIVSDASSTIRRGILSYNDSLTTKYFVFSFVEEEM